VSGTYGANGAEYRTEPDAATAPPRAAAPVIFSSDVNCRRRAHHSRAAARSECCDRDPAPSQRALSWTASGLGSSSMTSTSSHGLGSTYDPSKDRGGRVDYGFLPSKLFASLVERIERLEEGGKVEQTSRDE
jgi:hypothetical protein